ncbi:MAG: hypothetical protein J6N76_02245 [Lachnospiraceae bacterium]|nr:hypothetical protein [Lachnospiraceae bacterium]
MLKGARIGKSLMALVLSLMVVIGMVGAIGFESRAECDVTFSEIPTIIWDKETRKKCAETGTAEGLDNATFSIEVISDIPEYSGGFDEKGVSVGISVPEKTGEESIITILYGWGSHLSESETSLNYKIPWGITVSYSIIYKGETVSGTAELTYDKTDYSNDEHFINGQPVTSWHVWYNGTTTNIIPGLEGSESEGSDSGNTDSADTPAQEETPSAAEETSDTPAQEETPSVAEETSDTSAQEETPSAAEETSDTPAQEEAPSTTEETAGVTENEAAPVENTSVQEVAANPPAVAYDPLEKGKQYVSSSTIPAASSVIPQSGVTVNGISEITNQAALATLPAEVNDIYQSYTSLGIIGTTSLSMDLDASGSGNVSFAVGEASTPEVPVAAIISHYHDGAWTRQFCDVGADGLSTAKFDSFSPIYITVIKGATATMLRSTGLLETEGTGVIVVGSSAKKAEMKSPATGDNVPMILMLGAMASVGIFYGVRRKTR